MNAPSTSPANEPLRFRSPRNIACVCFSNSRGGLELTTLRIASQLNGRNAVSTLITLPESPLASLAANENVCVETLRPKWKIADPAVIRGLRAIFKKNAIDTVIVFRSKDIHLAVLAALRLSNVRVYFYQQMQSGVDKSDWYHSFLFRRLSGWFTLTHRMSEDVKRTTRIREQKLHVVPLGRDSQFYRPSASRREASRRDLNIPPNAPLVGMIGRFDPQKGLQEFVASAFSIREKVPDVRFVIAGDDTLDHPEYRAQIVELIAFWNLSNTIVLRDGSADVRPVLDAFDVFVMPSHSETYGLLLIEAMAMKKPVIATDSGGVPDIVRHEVDGLLIPPKDIPVLTNAILRLLREPVLAERLALAGRTRAETVFEERTCIDTLVRLLDVQDLSS